MPVKVHSMVGIIPLLAVAVIDEQTLGNVTAVSKQFAEFLNREGLHGPEKLTEAGLLRA